MSRTAASHPPKLFGRQIQVDLTKEVGDLLQTALTHDSTQALLHGILDCRRAENRPRFCEQVFIYL
jgi:hypothetical protein